jgi:Ca2+-binding EF-hand superfamily protein
LINRAFKFFDLDGDGGVSLAEFGKTMEKLGVFIPTSHNLQQIFDHYDTNRNGVLDYSEFTNVFLGKEVAREPVYAIKEPA